MENLLATAAVIGGVRQLRIRIAIMPSFSRHGEFFVAVLITGPSSVMVRLRLTDVDDSLMEVRPLAPDLRFGNPDESSVRDAVLGGVASANTINATSYKVAEIQYQCDNDGKCALIRRAAYCIVERLIRFSADDFTGI